MRMTAEIRWFWAGQPASDFAAWFRAAGPAWGTAYDSKSRIDEYLRDSAQTALGIKRRGGSQGVEIKGLISTRPRMLALAGCACPIGLWGKWSSTLALDEGRLIKVAKQRWMRKFKVDGGSVRELAASESGERGSGCDAELTLLEGPDRTSWWTVGLEAFGAFDEVVGDLTATVAVLQRRSPPPLPAAEAMGYPGWLAARGW
jgi:hypothetical protein